MFKMILTILISVVLTLWIIFCVILFTYHYFIEVVLDLPITGQSPCTAHAALKRLIERLLQETLILPSLQKAQEQLLVSSDESNRTYEDLLATAIINKVISSAQNNLPSSSAASVSSRLSTSSRHRDRKEYFFGEETLDNKWKTTDLDTSSVSSLDEWIHSDSSFGSRKYVDRVTLTIKQDIEEVSPTDSENEEDDADYFHSATFLDEDEPNWFLQKKQFQGTHSPVPVPMLVPNPTTEAKVLIGDREIDETSDLSDIASDYGDLETVPGTQSLLVESKTVIGGKNSLQNGSESESSADSGVKEVDGRDRIGYDEPVYISRTDITVDDDNIEDASILSVYSNTEREAEYTEKYASLPRTIVKTPTPPSRPSLQKPTNPESTQAEENGNTKPNGNIKAGERDESVDEDEEQRKILEFTGIYSKREKEKWKHAIEMKNNPYSKENMEKRIQRSNSAVSSLFGPDYYARQASSPSGKIPKSSEIFKDSTGWISNEEIHKAIPVIVSQEDDVFIVDEAEPEPITPNIKPQAVLIPEVAEPAVSEITSDSDMSYVNFYDVENSQVYKKPKDGEVQFLEARPLPEEVVEKPDENANLASAKNIQTGDIQAVIMEKPRAKERKILSHSKVENKPDYTKAPSFFRQRTLPQPSASRNLKRFKSETDLLDDGFDKPPTVIGRKRDNTLISKIYQNPQVRSFALSSRHHLPVESTKEPEPTLRKQWSTDNLPRSPNIVNGRKRYDSSDFSLNERPKSFYSSEEDLIDSPSTKENESIPKAYQTASAINYRLKSSRQSVSSEDGLLSDHSSAHDRFYRSKGSSSITYSSNEDLLSIDGERTPRKKDNTLIFKIYQDPNVRNFALTNREYIPVSEEEISRLSLKSYSSEENLLESIGSLKDHNSHLPIKTNGSDTTLTADISLDSSKIELLSAMSPREPTERPPKHERKLMPPDPDINELKEKKIVHNILGQFQSPLNSEAIYTRKPREERKMSTDSEEVTVSVKDLKKRFENNDAKSTVVSSLTARSLSKQLRESLRN